MNYHFIPLSPELVAGERERGVKEEIFGLKARLLKDGYRLTLIGSRLDDPDCLAFITSPKAAKMILTDIRCDLILWRAKEKAKEKGLVRYKSERRTIAEWAQKNGMNPETIRWRLNQGWTVERALTETARKRKSGGC